MDLCMYCTSQVIVTELGPFICPAAHTDSSSKLAALPLEQRLHGASVKDFSSPYSTATETQTNTHRAQC